MKKSFFKEVYPIISKEFIKSEYPHLSTNYIISELTKKIDKHPIATFISSFDHYRHTLKVDGPINPAIKDIRNLIFCFGAEIPKTTSAVLRPKSISIAELEDRFVIEFLEPPKAQSSEIMQKWTQSLSENNYLNNSSSANDQVELSL